MNGIYILKEDGGLVGLSETQYDSEALLQRLLAEYPDLLAGEQINPDSPRRWLLVCREAGIPGEEGGGDRWSVDHLFLDQDGIPTLVEVKRSTDTRIRREVVGQMLDYAANAVAYWPIEAIQSQLDQSCAERNEDRDEVIKAFLGPDEDEDKFWQGVKTNLQAGRIRMLFVADLIPDELRRVVEFLNQQMDPAEILALEIRQFVGGSLKTLVPRVMGQTAEAERRKSSGLPRLSRQWDEQSFFAALDDRGAGNEMRVARDILDWAKSRTPRIWWGKGLTNGSFVPVLHRNGMDQQPFAVFTGGSQGRASVEIYFYWHAYKRPFDDQQKRVEMLQKLNQIPGVLLPEDSINRRPNISLETLAEGDRLSRFLEVFDWYIEQISISLD